MTAKISSLVVKEDVDNKDFVYEFEQSFKIKLLNNVERSEDQCRRAKKIQREQHLETSGFG